MSKYASKNIVASLLVFALLLFTGCGSEINNQTDTTPRNTESSAECTLPIYITETTPASQTETTMPDLSLSVESGSFLMRYTDENTTDYLDYYLFIPENAEINMPLIVFLHGDGEVNKIEALENYGLMVKAREIYGNEFPFIAIFPCSRVYSWTEGSIPETLFGLIESTVEDCSIDRDRIIITGHSRGSMGTWNMISTYGDYFSAAVPVSCGADVTLDYAICAKVPVLAFAGTSGEMEYKYQNAMRRIVQHLTDAGGIAELVILQGCTHGDTSEYAYTEETFRWMLEQ